jgi:hypothetical protein
MKLACALVVGILCPVLSFCQIQKGAIVFSGGGSYNSADQSYYIYRYNNSGSLEAKSVSDRSSFITIQPSVGLFVSPSFMVGAGLGFEYQGAKYFNINPVSGAIDPGKRNRGIVSLNVFFKKYIPLKDKFYFNAALSISGGLGAAKYSTSDTDLRNPIFSARANLSPGFTYFISNKWAITSGFGQLYYNYTAEKLDQDDVQEDLKNKTNQWGLSFQLNTFSIGVQYFLRNQISGD